MATDKIFWKDAYLTRLDTTVAAVAGDDIRLDATIFFAFSGGQESDAGTIGGSPVLAARKEGLDIVYTLTPGHGLSAGDAVAIQIDWERRYGLMRHHFAAEMVLQLVYRLEPGIEKGRRPHRASHGAHRFRPVRQHRRPVRAPGRRDGRARRRRQAHRHRVLRRGQPAPLLGGRGLFPDGLWRHASAHHARDRAAAPETQEPGQGRCV